MELLVSGSCHIDLSTPLDRPCRVGPPGHRGGIANIRAVVFRPSDRSSERPHRDKVGLFSFPPTHAEELVSKVGSVIGRGLRLRDLLPYVS